MDGITDVVKHPADKFQAPSIRDARSRRDLVDDISIAPGHADEPHCLYLPLLQWLHILTFVFQHGFEARATVEWMDQRSSTALVLRHVGKGLVDH